MDNKIFKRIVAAAAGVTMLGTCAFATGLTTASYEDGTLSFDYTVAEGATKVTYLAYAATVAGENDTTFTTVDGTNYVLGNIVAVNQLDEIPETKSEAVAISADLLGEATNIVLMSGDDLGSAVALAAVATTTAPAGPTVTFVNGSESTPVVAGADGKVVLPANPTLVAEEGYVVTEFTFVGWVDADGNAFTADTVVEADTTVYAKYDTGMAIGNIDAVDGSEEVDDMDISLIIDYIDFGDDYYKVGEALYPGIDVLHGNIDGVDGSEEVDDMDISLIIDYIDFGDDYYSVGEKIYFVNKN